MKVNDIDLLLLLLSFDIYIFIILGVNLMNNQQVAIKFESRKSDAPQLRDEYRTYKVLAGLSKV